MGRRDSAHDDELDDLDDPVESDMDDSNDPELMGCPYCNKLISEDAERCHHCGNYSLPDDARGPIPWWLLAGAVLAGLAVLTWIVI